MKKIGIFDCDDCLMSNLTAAYFGDPPGPENIQPGDFVVLQHDGISILGLFRKICG